LSSFSGPEQTVGATNRSRSDNLQRVLVIAGEEFFDMGRYLVAGSLLAAAMQTLVPQSLLLQFGQGAATSVLARSHRQPAPPARKTLPALRRNQRAGAR
jgi:uncharacterized membrane protein YraQ (UPF0718 family)